MCVENFKIREDITFGRYRYAPFEADLDQWFHGDSLPDHGVSERGHVDLFVITWQRLCLARDDALYFMESEGE